LWDGETRIDQAGYTTDLLADATIHTLERRAADHKPFFISLHFTAPHWPWEGNDEEGRAESARLAGGSGIGGIQHYDGGTLATYAKMMKSLDDNIGRVLARLAELGFDRDTIVVFTSDNGGERFSDTWPFTGKKTELLEGGLRIPAIVRWPGVVSPGSRSNEPIMSMDWLPTFVSAGGGQPSAAFPSDGDRHLAGARRGTLPDAHAVLALRQQAAARVRRGQVQVPQDQRQRVPVRRRRRPARARQPQEPPARAVRRAQGRRGSKWDAGMLHDPTASSAGKQPEQPRRPLQHPAAAATAGEQLGGQRSADRGAGLAGGWPRPSERDSSATSRAGTASHGAATT
jgi:hypothetical protein